MKLTFKDSTLPFGANVKTIFTDSHLESIDSIYYFVTGPSATIDRTDGDQSIRGAWTVKFDGQAEINFGRGVYHFNIATVVQTETSYEMFIALLFKNTARGDGLIYTVKEL
ncbi:hypothetical protein P0E69_09575 [Chimaeribacter arupi]|uniref:hypothetical protein n=1 Tax=Chimaeribacter arupi TaxID=2060066 RepID=UPI0027120A04|nr:hypothetical protein [Chimaeribacter arupi]WKZ94094.1 hypothetical protein P0E69_09575 [Chimaeribacter arupi]